MCFAELWRARRAGVAPWISKSTHPSRSALVNIRRKGLLSSVTFRKRRTSHSPRGSSCDSCKLRFDRPLWLIFVLWSDVCFEVLSCFFDHPSIDSTKRIPLHMFGKDVFKNVSPRSSLLAHQEGRFSRCYWLTSLEWPGIKWYSWRMANKTQMNRCLI